MLLLPKVTKLARRLGETLDGPVLLASDLGAVRLLTAEYIYHST